MSQFHLNMQHDVTLPDNIDTLRTAVSPPNVDTRLVCDQAVQPLGEGMHTMMLQEWGFPVSAPPAPHRHTHSTLLLDLPSRRSDRALDEPRTRCMTPRRQRPPTVRTALCVGLVLLWYWCGLGIASVLLLVCDGYRLVRFVLAVFVW